jgi:hypothetical protein
MEQMKIKIGPLLFDHVDYDAEHDILYLHWGSRDEERARRRRRGTSSAMLPTRARSSA